MEQLGDMSRWLDPTASNELSSELYQLRNEVIDEQLRKIPFELSLNLPNSKFLMKQNDFASLCVRIFDERLKEKYATDSETLVMALRCKKDLSLYFYSTAFETLVKAKLSERPSQNIIIDKV